MPAIPPQQPIPPTSGPLSIPKSPDKNTKIKFSVLLYQMYGAIAGLYAFLTQDTLKGLNSTLRFYSDQENIIAGKLACLQGAKCPNKHLAAINLLKNEQEQAQTNIQSVQATITGVSSGVSTMASQLMGINNSVYQAMSGIIQNM